MVNLMSNREDEAHSSDAREEQREREGERILFLDLGIAVSYIETVDGRSVVGATRARLAVVTLFER